MGRLGRRNWFSRVRGGGLGMGAGGEEGCCTLGFSIGGVCGGGW